MLRFALLIGLVAAGAGCELLPEAAHEPMVYNPFPQLSRVAVAPFFNLSDDPTVDGHRFAKAYFAELQAIPGFDVAPLSIVETAMRQHGIELNDPAEARRLARILGVDAVVIGAVTDYWPYYPPRLGLKVQWWAADECIDEIPPGYGLPWGTTDEEFIPESVIFEAEMASAKAHLASQTTGPPVGPETLRPPALPIETVPPLPPETGPIDAPNGNDILAPPGGARGDRDRSAGRIAAGDNASPDDPSRRTGVRLASDWDQPRRFKRPTLMVEASGEAPCRPNSRPVLSHTRIYHGHDAQITDALANYFFFRNDARFGGWQSYLQRSEDFIRFSCHMHISELLTARGGAGETRVVWQWSHSR